MLVAVVFKRRPVYLVGAALDLHVDGGAAGQALLGVETVGYDVHFLDRLQRRNVRHHVRQLDVRSAYSVDTRVVLVVTCAVDIELQCA